jgi:hypothetical protein
MQCPVEGNVCGDSSDHRRGFACRDEPSNHSRGAPIREIHEADDPVLSSVRPTGPQTKTTIRRDLLATSDTRIFDRDPATGRGAPDRRYMYG